MAEHPISPHLNRRLALLCLLAGIATLSTTAVPQSPTPTEAEIIQRMDAAVLARSNEIESYSVQEQYSLYRNGESTPSAEETVKTSYTYAAGKEYTPVSQSGSAMLRSAVIDKILAGEKEMNQPANRESVWITSANYDMHPEPASVTNPVPLNGHTCMPHGCFIIDLNPKRKSPHLFNGKVWIDAADYTVVRLDGTPSLSPSIFASGSVVTRDYEKIDGFAMATHAEAHAHSFLLGDTVLKIDYTGYLIQRKAAQPASAPAPAPTPAPPSVPTPPTTPPSSR